MEVYVVDVRNAHVKVCERLLSLSNDQLYEVFNSDTGAGYSAISVIKESDKQSKIKIGVNKNGDAAAVYADVSKADNILRWKTEARLEDMVKLSWS